MPKIISSMTVTYDERRSGVSALARFMRAQSARSKPSPKIATDPPVSEKQRKAMFAAANGKSTLNIPKKVGEEFVGKTGAHDAALTFDRQSIREYDAFGRMHVKLTPISKACINPYIGKEIPGFDVIGLDPDRIYKLFRDPEELQKAVGTANNIQLLEKHEGVTPDEPKKEIIVGSTGTDAVFDPPYLKNTLVIWERSAIDGVEDESKRELSCGYAYDPDMTPGTYEGEAYDGVMRNIVFNHVSLVKEGRAGPDVLVGDSMENLDMSKKATPLTRKAAMVQGAVHAFLVPMLAKDAKIDLSPVLQGLNAKNYDSRKSAIVKHVEKAIVGKLASDASPEGLATLLDALSDVKPAEGKDNEQMVTQPNSGLVPANPKKKKMVDNSETETSEDEEVGGGEEDPEARVKAFLQGKLSDEDMAQLDTLLAACKDGSEDEDPEFENAEDEETDAEDDITDHDGRTPDMGKSEAAPTVNPGKDGAKDKRGKGARDNFGGKGGNMVTKAAMDAQIQTAVDVAVANVNKRQQAIREAERAIAPYVGHLSIACDSAEKVYRTALKMLGVDGVEKVHSSALPVLLNMQPKPGIPQLIGGIGGGTRAPSFGGAMDAAGTDDFYKMFPEVARIKSA